MLASALSRVNWKIVGSAVASSTVVFAKLNYDNRKLRDELAETNKKLTSVSNDFKRINEEIEQIRPAIEIIGSLSRLRNSISSTKSVDEIYRNYESDGNLEKFVDEYLSLVDETKKDVSTVTNFITTINSMMNPNEAIKRSEFFGEIFLKIRCDLNEKYGSEHELSVKFSDSTKLTDEDKEMFKRFEREQTDLSRNIERVMKRNHEETITEAVISSSFVFCGTILVMKLFRLL